MTWLRNSLVLVSVAILGIVFGITFISGVSRDVDLTTLSALIIPRKNNSHGLETVSRLSLSEQKNVHIENRGTYSMLFVGDIMMDRGIKNIAKKRSEGYLYPFLNIEEELKKADLVFGNLEGPIGENGTLHGSKYSFRMEPEVARVLKNVGFDIVSVANNHMGDYGLEALEETFHYLHKEDLFYTGGGETLEHAEAPTILQVGDNKIAFLAFSDVGPQWIEADTNRSGILIARPKDITRIVRQADAEADILIVSFHFGDEYKTTSNERQKLLARTAIDAGASLVVGHHPHVAEEIEKYKEGVIAYSLGNFIFDQAFSPDTKKAIMLEVMIKEGAIIHVEPIHIEFNEVYQPRVSQ